MKTSLNIYSLIACALLTVLTACSSTQNKVVEIETPFGTMHARLYDDTPNHRDNFVKLASDGAYDSLLFHRVLRNYIIQGGDPESRNAEPGVRLGMTSIGDNIDAEILFPTHFHKRGALAMARQSDATNPEKRSSGSQFYIVTGQLQTEQAMTEAETIHDNKTRRQIYQEILKFYEDSLTLLQKQGRAQELSDMQIRIIERVEMLLQDRGMFKFTDEIRQEYAEHGGLPQLDGDYTVFGEIIDGFNVLDSINQVSVTPPSMRPYHDVWMKIKVVD